MDYETQQELMEIKNQLGQMNYTIDGLAMAMANQQQFINNILQTINMQINAINQNTQTTATLYAKISDMEISNSSLDDAVQEAIQSNNSIISEMQELKQAVEAIRFYSFNSLVNQNP